MPPDDSYHRINELLALAGLANQTRAAILVRGVLESISSGRLLRTDTEFEELLRQIPERQPHER
jgi:hypothetical protein